MNPAEALTWLRDPPALWSAGDDSGRRLLTEALFEKVEVPGVKSARIHPTPEADAHGWSDAFGTEPILIPIEILAQSIGMYGRGEVRVKTTVVRQRPTRRQLEVLRAYIAAGSIAGAADELDIADSTARQHLSCLYRRTGCLNIAQAAYRLGAGELVASRSRGHQRHLR